MADIKDLFKYYLDNQIELVSKYDGKFLVIKDNSVVGVFDTQEEAYVDSVSKYELGTFLIQKCTAGEDEYTQHYYSRVAFVQAMIDPNAFTFTSPNKERALITACGVSIAFSQQTVMQRPPFRRVNGLWDTGATNSVINENIAFELGLKPVGVAKVHHANGESTVNRYLVNIMLPNNIIIEMVPVTAGKLSGTDVLIGMDIISMGDFSICHKNGGTTFSFQIPSTHDINFVDEIKEQRKKDKDTKTL